MEVCVCSLSECYGSHGELLKAVRHQQLIHLACGSSGLVVTILVEVGVGIMFTLLILNR